MTDEELKNVSSQDVAGMDANSYIEALNQLKASTVDKTLLEQAQEENKRLLNALANQRPIETTQVVDDGPTKEQLEKVITGEQSNLAIITASLKHREMMLEETGRDEYAIGASKGGLYNPTSEALAKAQATAEALENLVNEAQGDADYFDTLLQRSCR